MVNRVNAAVGLLGAVVMFEVLLRLLVYRDIHLQVPHLLVNLLLAQAETLNVDGGAASGLILV